MKKTLLLMILALSLSLLPGLAAAAPAAPTLSYSTAGLSISVAWTPVSGATGYKLAYAPYPWMPWMTMDDIGYVDMGAATNIAFYLWEGAAFYIAVQAYDSQGSSDFSNIEYFIMGPPTLTWVDNDGDGYHENSGDCDDGNAAIHPAAPEVCGDVIDQDCNGADASCVPADVDHDLDGYTESQGDCNDDDPATRPGGLDICEDGIDQDCSGADRACPQNIDDDLDGFTENQGDCNDANSGINPGADDICGDEIDQDCSGADPICQLTADAPAFSPVSGTFTYGQFVTLTSATPETQFRYTTDGTTPTGYSNLYRGPIPVNTSMTIKAFAFRSGYNPSPVTEGTYTIDPSLTGTWAITHTTGSNSCNQTVGETIQFNADVVQTGNTVTVTTAAGSGSGTLNGNQATWTTTQPVNYESINGTVTFTMNVTVAPSWNNFSGPTSFSFTDGTVSCSGVGTIAGTRVL